MFVSFKGIYFGTCLFSRSVIIFDILMENLRENNIL